MSRHYSDREVSEARRLNRIVESAWEDNIKEGKKPATQAEASYRKERNRS